MLLKFQGQYKVANTVSDPKPLMIDTEAVESITGGFDDKHAMINCIAAGENVTGYSVIGTVDGLAGYVEASRRRLSPQPDDAFTARNVFYACAAFTCMVIAGFIIITAIG